MKKSANTASGHNQLSMSIDQEQCVLESQSININIAGLSKRRRYALYEGVTTADRVIYHHLSQRPLTNQGELTSATPHSSLKTFIFK